MCSNVSLHFLFSLFMGKTHQVVYESQPEPELQVEEWDPDGGQEVVESQLDPNHVHQREQGHLNFGGKSTTSQILSNNNIVLFFLPFRTPPLPSLAPLPE